MSKVIAKQDPDLRAAALLTVLGRAQDGDRKAFAEIYRRFHHSVLAGYLTTGSSYEDSWDLMQETFIHVLRGLQTLDLTGEVRFQAWLRRIAMNVLRRRASKERKWARRSYVIDSFPDIPDAGTGGTGGTDDYGALMKCLDSLDENGRRLIVYRFVFDYSGRNIARLLGAAESTLRMRLNKVLALIRACLSRHGVLFH